MKKEDLAKLRVKDLRALIVTHNLHNAIRRYSVMRKAELINVLHEHSKTQTIKIKLPKSKERPSSPEEHHHHESEKAPQTPPKRAKKPSDKKDGEKKKPKRKASSKPKMTGFDKAMGIDKPLFSKEETDGKGLKEGAMRQFMESHLYGAEAREADRLALLKLGKKKNREQAGNHNKRVRKQNKSDDFDYPSVSVVDRHGRGKRKKIANKKYA